MRGLDLLVTSFMIQIHAAVDTVHGYKHDIVHADLSWWLCHDRRPRVDHWVEGLFWAFCAAFYGVWSIVRGLVEAI